MLLGGTVGELKSKVSWVEFGSWVKYFNKHGRCGPVRRFDRGAALICWKIDHAMGGKTEIHDYIPKFEEQVSMEAPVKSAIAMFGGVIAR